jgi:HD-GYP domain-containing protein (c-di-GMP phosphodiesterase class II)
MIPPPPEPPRQIRDARGQALRTLRARCAALGLHTWRTDNAGLILDEPAAEGPVALLLGSSGVTGLISRAAATLSRDASTDTTNPEPVELFDGAWAIALAEHRRRHRTGWTLALALSERALSGEHFARICASAALDAPALRRMLAPAARFDLASARAVRDMLLWMGQDLAHAEESDQSVAGFTRQLSDAFETIDLLYTLGRSMNELDQPEHFAKSLADRVRATLGFRLVCVVMADDRAGPLGASLITSGESPAGDMLEAGVRAMLRDATLPAKAAVLSEIDARPIPGCSQALVHPLTRAGRIVGALCAADKTGDDPQVSSYDIQLLEAAAGYLGAFLDNAGLYAEQKSLFHGTLDALTAAIDAKDRYTCGHSRRVAHLSRLLALAHGLPAEQAQRVHIAGLVHDVGKIGVPEAVLTKSGRLTDEEFNAIKLHPEIGHRILKDLPALADVLPGVLHHHERFDGRGYPHALAGRDIPLMARIIALADTFDAMSSTRSYRAAMDRPRVLAEIARCAGAQFDPDLAAAFVRLDFTEYDRMVAADTEASGHAPGLVASSAPAEPAPARRAA